VWSRQAWVKKTLPQLVLLADTLASGRFYVARQRHTYPVARVADSYYPHLVELVPIAGDCRDTIEYNRLLARR
jgi:hypothetical protein